MWVRGYVLKDSWARDEIDLNPTCEYCGRSVIARGGEVMVDTECESCRSDSKRIYEHHDGNIESDEA